MGLKVLTEASGSFTAASVIRAIKEAGCQCVASDIDAHCAGRYLADDFILMPGKNDPQLWDKVTGEIIKHEVDVVLPSFDETLQMWADHKEELKAKGIQVIISPAETIATFQDKWLTYLFFDQNGIPTPCTSLEQKYPLVKPRVGRGSVGVRVATEKVEMEGNISQELVEGEEYTVDVFCNKFGKPVYIIPRKRLGVKEGKSTGGIVVFNKEIDHWVRRICDSICFYGPINMQCFVCDDGSIKFIEINPRIAGGMALGFAASENWVSLIIDHLISGKDIVTKPVLYGLEMRRYYAEVFISPSQLG